MKIIIGLLVLALSQLLCGFYVSPQRFVTVVLPAPLSGATVYAQLQGEAVAVTSVYHGSWGDLDAETICMPISAPEGMSAYDCLKASALAVRIGSVELFPLVPAEVSGPKITPPPNTKLYWFQVSLSREQLTALQKEPSDAIRIEYRQSLIGGHFYYIPTVADSVVARSFDPSWAFQMIVRSKGKILASPAGHCDFDRFTDMLVVYLKDRELVDIPMPFVKNG